MSEARTYIVITPFFPSQENFRGPYVLDQVNAIKRNSDYNVVVLRPKPMFSKLQDYDFEGVKVHYFRRLVLPSNMLPGLFDGVSKYFFLKKLKRLEIRYQGIAVVHVHVTNTAIYAKILKTKFPRTKTVLQHHGFDVLSLENGILRNFKWHRNWVRKYGIKLCNAMDVNIGVSQKTLGYLMDFKEIRPKATFVLYNGVDFSKFFPITGLKDTNVFKIGCIANFWPIKDQMTLIKAAHLLITDGMENLRVVFIGTGKCLEPCKNYVAMHHLENHIVFKQEVKHQGLNKFYNTLDLFVLPSYYEAFGCVYTEAFACGVPFMAVKDQGIAELIPQEDKDKWLIRSNSTDDLVTCILRYDKYRKSQKLTQPIEIDFLMKKYVKYLNTLKIV